jgi:hypothetical protein
MRELGSNAPGLSTHLLYLHCVPTNYAVAAPHTPRTHHLWGWGWGAVPPEYAYGNMQVQEIPPGATLQLDLELLSIKTRPS